MVPVEVRPMIAIDGQIMVIVLAASFKLLSPVV